MLYQYFCDGYLQYLVEHLISRCWSVDRCGQLDKSNCEGGTQWRYWQIVTTVATVTEEVETVPSVTSIRSVDSRADNGTKRNFTVPGEGSYWNTPTTAFTIKNILRYYENWDDCSVRKDNNIGWEAIRILANQTTRWLWFWRASVSIPHLLTVLVLSASMRFRQGEGCSRGLLWALWNFAKSRWQL